MLAKLASLLPGRRSDERRLAVGIPDGQRVYAIGDIHGRADLLRALISELKADAAGYKGQVTLVGIGDYIDRGPDSKSVVDILLHELPKGWQAVFLRGNHEQAMLDYLKDPESSSQWLAWGGIQAMESYGLKIYGAKGVRDMDVLAAEFKYALNELGHGDFYAETKLSFELGGYLFVHAGVRRGIAANRQLADDLLFIREDFIGRPHDLPYRVVYGHTIVAEPLVLEDRIGIDTGAFQSGVLTAVKLESDTTEIIQALDATATRAQQQKKEQTL